MNLAQHPDGSYAEPLRPRGLVARVEFWLRARGLRRLADGLGRFDERGLGR